jgi:hypothetical protein
MKKKIISLLSSITLLFLVGNFQKVLAQCGSCTSQMCCYSSCEGCYRTCASTQTCQRITNSTFCDCTGPTPTPTPIPGGNPTSTPTPTSGGGGGGGGTGGATATPTPTSTPAPQCAPNPGSVSWGSCRTTSDCPASTSNVSCSGDRCVYSDNLQPCPSASCPSRWVPGGWSCSQTPNAVSALFS